MSELAAILEAVRLCGKENTPRLVFADWLDENYPSPHIRRGELPKGFNAHWHENAMYLTLGVRALPRGRGKWSNSDILKGLAASAKTMKAAWLARAGASEIGGYPVLVSEPQLSQPRALRVCRALQWAAGGCPVSFNRCAQRGRVRIVIWFTALPSMEQRMIEVADLLSRIHREK